MSVFAKNIKKSVKILSAALALSLLSALAFAEPYKHTVQKGETYYGISRMYGISVDELCKANNCTTNDVLKIGQVLVIPGKEAESAAKTDTPKTDASKTDTSKTSTTKTETSKTESTSSKDSSTRSYDIYTVQKGDTLWHIAQVNGIKVDELKSLNGMTNDTSLKIGQELKVPKTVIDTNTATLPDLSSSDPRKYSEKKGDSKLTWPVKNPEVTYINGKVSGVQLSAEKNENVTSIRAGTVMYVGNYRGYGQVVFIQSKTEHIYAYTGLGTIKVKKGDYVVFGEVIGTAGTDSIKGTPQISLMVFQKSNPIDPAKAPRG